MIEPRPRPAFHLSRAALALALAAACATGATEPPAAQSPPAGGAIPAALGPAPAPPSPSTSTPGSDGAPVAPADAAHVTAADSAASPAPACPAGALAPGDHERTFTFGGLTRSYKIYVPRAATPGPLPVLFAFHGGASDATRYNKIEEQMRPKAEAAGFVLVSPRGSGNNPRMLGWNAGTCCGSARNRGVDDVGFVRAIVDRLPAEACVDPKRIYAAGFSNGGMLTHRLGCELADKIAAIAAGGGGMAYLDLDVTPPRSLFACRPPRAVPVLHYHGLLDACYPFEGGVGAGLSDETKTSIPQTMAVWRGVNGCQERTRTILSRGDARCDEHEGCAAAGPTVLCTTTQGGHVLPGSSQQDQPGCRSGVVPRDLDWNDLVWEFVSRQRLP